MLDGNLEECGAGNRYRGKSSLAFSWCMGGALSGLNGLVLADTDYERLRKGLEKKLRAMMLGAATIWTDGKAERLPSEAVWRAWRLVPPKVRWPWPV